ncbi:FmdB family transcriptional regulator [Paramagnetospirillum kuznetsovii]|uniref:FmdB family transcriptional regulator n=1 Tax=Paramagnetospirillum kuznetsovii TaxID=2053833 RepID=A0A364P0P2_9PROT|nr:zinc ribbon domain-containing protein [Paramagnetospirillum kuznetsovii]RAU22918.1 FmdB family transcriptional regulator [Paramagnetospirillum kuznetsovii]
MPLFTYSCKGCEAIFETLVRASDTPTCPACGSGDLERQIAAIAPDAKFPGVKSRVRAQAAREGHFSNYSRSERPKK